jgi:hypothetical protein
MKLFLLSLFCLTTIAATVVVAQAPDPVPVSAPAPASVPVSAPATQQDVILKALSVLEAHAQQSADPAVQKAVADALPSALVIYAPLIALLFAAYGRYNQGRKNGLSPFDAFMTVLNGANKPTASLLIACLCMLGLSSCQTMDKFFASPEGKATVSFVELGVDVAAAAYLPPGSNVLINQGIAIVTNPNKPGLQRTFELEQLGLDKAVDAKLIKDGDKLIIQEGSAIIQSAIAPVVPSAKQPVNVTTAAVSRARQNRLKPVLHNVPACLQLAGGIPLYGERVAFVLSTGPVK